MNTAKLLLLLIIFLPLLNCATIHFAANLEKLSSFAVKFFPILFLGSLIGLYSNSHQQNPSLVFVEPFEKISFGFAVDKISFGFLFLLDFFWLIFAFYSQRFFALSSLPNSNSFRIFLTLIIAFLNLIILSKNLLTILFFYSALVILSHFFAVQLIYKKEDRFSQIFTFLLYLESALLFLAIVAGYKFAGQVDFIEGGFVNKINLLEIKTLLFVLYLVALFLSLLLPFYLLYRNFTFDLTNTYLLFFFSYAISAFYILFKLLYFVFGLQEFSLIILKIGFDFIELIFLANIFIAFVCLAFTKDFKSSFFYLLIEQLLFTLFVILTFASFGQSRIYLPLLSFFLSMNLIYLCLSNILLYFMKATNKRAEGLFFNLKITSILLIFAVLNLAGLAPGIGAIENFFFIKIILQKNLLLSAVILVLNFMALAAFSWKIIYPLFLKSDEKESAAKADIELARNIDFDSSLILTALIVAIAMFLSLIFFPFL